MTRNLKAELIGGLTTFLSMSYIIVVNPAILATEGTGMSFTGVLSATILVSFISTFLMGAWARLPFALAPGMGINAFFTYELILGHQLPWQQALGLTCWSGIIFILISVTPLRQKIVEAIPSHLKQAIAVGIGLFICLIGLKNAGIIVSHPATMVGLGAINQTTCLVFFSVAILLWLDKKQVPGSSLLVIIGLGVIHVLTHQKNLPQSWFSLPDLKSHFFQIDLIAPLKFALLPPLFGLIMTDMFDSLSTFIGVGKQLDPPLREDSQEF